MQESKGLNAAAVRVEEDALNGLQRRNADWIFHGARLSHVGVTATRGKEGGRWRGRTGAAEGLAIVRLEVNRWGFYRATESLLLNIRNQKLDCVVALKPWQLVQIACGVLPYTVHATWQKEGRTGIRL